MNNKFIIKEISKKNNIKLNRNSSLDSTKSSLRVKKIKLHNEFTPFTKLAQNSNYKNILDFPICMSLFTNNYSLSEKDPKINVKNKLNLNYQNIKNNNLLKKNKQNELLLPKTKRVISRNANGLFIHSFSPINSIVKSSILNQNKFTLQLSKNISKPILKKINYSPLTNFTNQNEGNKMLKKYNYNTKNNNISYSTLEQEISAIKNVKNNNTIGDINCNINEIKKLKLPIHFFTPRDNGANGAKIDNLIFSSSRVINKINKKQGKNMSEEKNNKINNNNLTSSISNNLTNLENISENIEIKTKIIFNKKKDNNNSNIINKKKINNNNNKLNINLKKRKKINQIKEKINKSTEDINENNKIEIRNIKKTFKRSPTRKQTLHIPQTSKDNKEIEKEKSDNNQKYPINLMVEKEKLKKIKASKFYLAINNKKTIDIYKKNDFLNQFNKEISKKSINNSINTKIFIQKTEMLVNNKEIIGKLIVKEEQKLKPKEASLVLSQSSKEQSISVYFQSIKNNKKEIEKYNDIIMSLCIIKLNYKINSNLCHLMREYIFTYIKFGELSSSIQSNKTHKKRGSCMINLKLKNSTKSLKRQNTLSPIKKVIFNNELEDAFTLKKTKNHYKKDLKWTNDIVNLISIHDYILKSLPYSQEINLKEINNNNKFQNKLIKKKSRFFFRQYSRRISKKLVEINNFGINSSKILLNLNDNEFSKNKKILVRRGSTIFNLDDFTKSLKKQLSQKSTDSFENFSILKRKNFFKKTVIIKDNKKDSHKSINERDKNKKNTKEIIKNLYENEKDDIDEEQIYFELIRFVIEGKNKNFENFYNKNKNSIDINQELFDKNTLLILCAKEGNYYITKFLCEQGAEVNYQNNSGNTALHYALGKQFYAIADILTRHGAKEDIRNLKGLTPWDCIEHNIE